MRFFSARSTLSRSAPNCSARIVRCTERSISRSVIALMEARLLIPTPAVAAERRMTVPKARPNFNLIEKRISCSVLSGACPHGTWRAAPAVRLSENPFHVGYDDEIAVPLADAADEVGAAMHADPLRFLG